MSADKKMRQALANYVRMSAKSNQESYMPARKKPVPKSQPPRPELSVQPRRGRVIFTLVLCLIVFAAISQAVGAILLTPTANGIGSEILFAFLYLAGTIYLLGIAWSSVRLLSDSRP